MTALPRPLRCAVYTRKSSEEGLEQAFNSLHAQRAACEAYVLSQAGEGWTALPQAYDDGGVSGATVEREGLQRLLGDVAAGRVDVVVVYKVDRLTRSLADFARIIEAFDKAGVSFVSVTQAFNTTSSMGRLTLNVLLSFAQFEREVTGERIRDKIALSKAKGLWMGGVLPLGYDVCDHRLAINPAEAPVVRHIFKRYLDLGSVRLLAEQLDQQSIRSKRWTTQQGRAMGGVAFGRGALFHLLQNRDYLGEIVHKAIRHPGMHEAIVPAALYEAVQARLQAQRVSRRRNAAKPASALLTGRIFDGEGRRYTPSFSTGRSGRIHRYYVLAPLQSEPALSLPAGALRRVSADAVERCVLQELRRLADRAEIGPAELTGLLLRLELRACETHLVLRQDALFRGDHPDLALEDLRARLRPGERAVAEAGQAGALRLALPRRMQLRGGRTWSVAPTANRAHADRADPVLVGALQRAHLIASRSSDASPPDSYERKLIALAFLAPDLQQALLQGRHPVGLTLATLLRADIPIGWSEQRAWFERLA